MSCPSRWGNHGWFMAAATQRWLLRSPLLEGVLSLLPTAAFVHPLVVLEGQNHQLQLLTRGYSFTACWRIPRPSPLPLGFSPWHAWAKRSHQREVNMPIFSFFLRRSWYILYCKGREFPEKTPVQLQGTLWDWARWGTRAQAHLEMDVGNEQVSLDQQPPSGILQSI